MDANLANERCWETGNYSDLCVCDICEHSGECSGFEDEDDDEE